MHKHAVVNFHTALWRASLRLRAVIFATATSFLSTLAAAALQPNPYPFEPQPACECHAETTETAQSGAITRYTYNSAGNPLTSTNAQTAGTATLASLYTYTLSGQLASASLPSGHQISYSYDAAQRLVGWQDNRGARGVYTLDAMGNRSTEQIQNSAGQVVWQLARSINALNRVASETVGAAAGTVNNNLQTSYGYNANASQLQGQVSHFPFFKN